MPRPSTAYISVSRRDAVRIAVESAWSVFGFIIELGERLDPLGKDLFLPLECLDPF